MDDFDSLFTSKAPSKPKQPKRTLKPSEPDSPPRSGEVKHRLFEPVSGPSVSKSKVIEVLCKNGLSLNGRKTFTDETFDSLIGEKMLPLDNFFSGKAKKSAKSTHPTLISFKHNPQNLYSLKGLRYESAVDLNTLWKTYTDELLKLSAASTSVQIGRLVKTVELVGAELSVVESINKDNIGLKGICVKDGKNSVTLISKDHKIRILPKDACHFLLSFSSTQFSIDGKSLIRSIS